MIRTLKTARDPPPPLVRRQRRGAGRWNREMAERGRAIRGRRQRGPPLSAFPRSAWRGGVGPPPPEDHAGSLQRQAGVIRLRCPPPARRFAPGPFARRKAGTVTRPPPAPWGTGCRPRAPTSAEPRLTRRREVGRPPRGERRRARRPQIAAVRRQCRSSTDSCLAPKFLTRPEPDAVVQPPAAVRGTGHSKRVGRSGPRGAILRFSFRIGDTRARSIVNDAFTLAPGARQFLP
jgi:hypothetical protein